MPMTVALLLLALQGRRLHETRTLEVASPDTKRVLHGDLSSEIADPVGRECTFSGSGNYMLLEGGKMIWGHTFPFAFSTACVLDDGRVAGIAWGENERVNVDAVHFVVIDARGNLLVDERIGVPTLGLDAVECANAPLGCYFDAANDRFTAWFWSQPRGGEEWRVWSGTTGRRVTWNPQRAPGEAASTCAGAAVVPGTPLVLAHRWIALDRPTLYRSTYVLLGADGSVLWTHAVDADHCEGQVLRPAPGASGIVGVETRAFTVRHFAQHENLRFELVPDATAPGGFKVSEGTRANDNPR